MTPFYIFVISVFVFLFFNIIENVIHYNIGVNTARRNSFRFFPPTKEDFILILSVMILFGILQGSFTLLIDSWVEKKKI